MYHTNLHIVCFCDMKKEYFLHPNGISLLCKNYNKDTKSKTLFFFSNIFFLIFKINLI